MVEKLSCMSSCSSNVSRVACSRFTIISALSSAQLGFIAAALVVWVSPSVNSGSVSDSASAIHRSILSELSSKPSSERSILAPRHNDSAAITLMSEKISDFGHADDSARVLAEAIVTESKSASLDPLLVAAVVKYESSFRTQAISHKGARGLMQVMPATEKALLKTVDTRNLDLHERQLRLGSQYLAELKKRFRGNLYHSLVAYNWGPTNLSVALKRGEKIPSGPSTYAKRVMAQHASWKGELQKQARLS